jgi:sec-independent protein translocase protein TatA
MRIGPLGIWELLIILVVVLLIFGPRRLPEMAKGLGQSVREFRKGIRDIRNDFEEGEKAESERGAPERGSAPAAGGASASAETAPSEPASAAAGTAAGAAAADESAETREADDGGDAVPAAEERDESKKVASDA